MLMNDLLKSELFKRLSNSSQEVTNEKMKNAYDAFLERAKILNQSENDYSLIIRILNLTRIEFVFLQSYIQYEQGEKCLKRSLFTESYFCY